jgi:hypothetical protein
MDLKASKLIDVAASWEALRASQHQQVLARQAFLDTLLDASDAGVTQIRMASACPDLSRGRIAQLVVEARNVKKD